MAALCEKGAETTAINAIEASFVTPLDKLTVSRDWRSAEVECFGRTLGVLQALLPKSLSLSTPYR